MPRGRRSYNPNASFLEKIAAVELKKECTQHSFQYMHVSKISEFIQK